MHLANATMLPQQHGKDGRGNEMLTKDDHHDTIGSYIAMGHFVMSCGRCKHDLVCIDSLGRSLDVDQ